MTGKEIFKNRSNDSLNQQPQMKFEYKKMLEKYKNVDVDIIEKCNNGELTIDEIKELPKEYDDFKDDLIKLKEFYDNGTQKIERNKLSQFIREMKLSNKISKLIKNNNKFSPNGLLKSIKIRNTITKDYAKDLRKIKQVVTNQKEIDDSNLVVPNINASDEEMKQIWMENNQRIILENKEKIKKIYL